MYLVTIYLEDEPTATYWHGTEQGAVNCAESFFSNARAHGIKDIAISKLIKSFDCRDHRKVS